MSDWNAIKLEDFATLKYGKLPSKDISSGNYPIWSGYKYVGTTNTFNCPKDTPIVVARGVGGTGDVKIAKVDCFLTNLSISVYLNEKICNPHFFTYYFAKDNLRYLDSGSAQSQITIEALKKVVLRLPTLAEQKKIAAILSSLDEKIETNRKINARLEEMAQALFKSWFIDFEPFGGKMPEDWNYKTIADFPHNIETGKRPKGGVSGITGGIPSIGAESIKGIGFYDYSKTKYIPFEYAETLKKGRIQDFDLLIYKDGGKPGYFIPDFSMMGLGFPFDEMFLNEHVFRLNLGKPELNIFAYFYFKTDEVMNYLNSVGGKAAIPGINQKNVEDIEILDLSIPMVLKFGSIVLPLFKTILENCKESARLAALRDTLLPKLMSGELIPE